MSHKQGQQHEPWGRDLGEELQIEKSTNKKNMLKDTPFF